MAEFDTMSVRARNCLRYINVNDEKDFKKCAIASDPALSVENLLTITGLGQKTLKEILEIGASLNPKYPDCCKMKREPIPYRPLRVGEVDWIHLIKKGLI